MSDLPKIYGFNESSEAGVDEFALSIFLGGCNLKCPYCLNNKLVPRIPNVKEVAFESIKENVARNDYKWVTISGGEPTLTPTHLLINLILEIKKGWGCKVSLSTNGTDHDVLKDILPLLDYVSLDCKTADDRIYADMGVPDALFNIIYSKVHLTMAKIARSNFDYEIRTTLYPPFIRQQDIEEIGSLLRRDDKWVLQRYRVIQPWATEAIGKPYSDENIDRLFKIAQQYSDQVVLKDV